MSLNPVKIRFNQLWFISLFKIPSLFVKMFFPTLRFDTATLRLHHWYRNYSILMISRHHSLFSSKSQSLSIVWDQEFRMFQLDHHNMCCGNILVLKNPQKEAFRPGILDLAKSLNRLKTWCLIDRFYCRLQNKIKPMILLKF